MRVSGKVVATILFGALAVPAFASGVIHSANSEIGYTTHPEHAPPGKTRAEVRVELDQARRDTTWNFYRVGAPLPVMKDAPLTRAQVKAELLRAQQHPSWSARRVGAPVSMN